MCKPVRCSSVHKMRPQRVNISHDIVMLFLADTEEFGFCSVINCTKTILDLRNMGVSTRPLYAYYYYYYYHT